MRIFCCPYRLLPLFPSIYSLLYDEKPFFAPPFAASAQFDVCDRPTLACMASRLVRFLVVSVACLRQRGSSYLDVGRALNFLRVGLIGGLAACLFPFFLYTHTIHNPHTQTVTHHSLHTSRIHSDTLLVC